jgi:hypothetical protein
MKALLIALNCIFALGITWGVLSNLGKPSVDEDEYFIKRKPGKKTTVRKTTSKKSAAVSNGPAQRTAAEIEQIIVEKNIFNPARCPNARVFGRRTGGNARLNLTLVGTFTIDNVSGAIILQRQQAQQNRMMMNQPWMMGRAMMMNQNNNNNNRFRQRFMPGMFPGMQNNNNNNNNQPAVVYKQYVRVGEVMANGYKLESVTRTSAVLTKGSERMELTIVEASQNAGGRSNTSNSNRNNNPFRMSPQQMRQWMQMMGGGRNNMGNWNRGGRNNNNNRNSMGNRR